MNDTCARIAIIEDNPDLREELLFFLQTQGFSAWGASSAEAFWKQLHRTPADIVLIDISLPGEDGFSVLEYLSHLGNYGLIAITAHDSEQFKQRGLGLGADLYMLKPVNFSSLCNAIRSLWHRMREQASVPDTPVSATRDSSTWALNHDSLTTPSGIALALTPQEYSLIDVLLRHRNEVCSKELLHDLLFGYENDPNTHRISVILSRLRTKARKQAVTLPIRAIFGKGLVFRDLNQ
ncbi:MAG: response regulator transcription factor [Oceanospirillales bacterium]|nr:response regulator transcription factor [Oceanospirillales bacterium]